MGHGGYASRTMTSDDFDPTTDDDADPGAGVSALEDLRERLRPRTLQGGEPALTTGERFALERVQALELQVATAHRRERELLELAVKDGNQLSALRAQVDVLGAQAARAEQAERALFEAESRAEGAVRRSELMDGELMSTRAEVDRLRTRIVELEASLRRALAEIGEAQTARISAVPPEQQADLEDSAERSLELADRLRLKVVDLEASLRAVTSRAGDDETSRLVAERADADEAASEIQRASEMAGASATAAAEVRLADLEERLAAIDARIAGLTGSMAPATEESEDERMDEPADEEQDIVVDLREDDEPEVMEELTPEPIKPPASRWSDWRTT
jgi:chromosome segregation ATPase